MAKTTAARPRRVIVTVTDQALPNIREVADKLAGHGLAVDRVLPVTGVVSGSCQATALTALRRVSGVESIEEEVDAHPSSHTG